MKIVHISLLAHVTDNLSYQDNLLPKFHKKMGNEVTIITSKYVWGDNGTIVVDKRDEYFNENDIKVIRLKNNKFKKMKLFKNLYQKLEAEEPDILFIHGVQFLDILTIVKFLKVNTSIRVYVDNHGDYNNSASTWISKNILHRIIWRYCAQKINPFVSKFYGVLPARVDFLNDMYKIPLNKIELLVMGADDQKIDKSKGEYIRAKYNIANDDFLIVTGGKINTKKQTLLLMKAVKQLTTKKVKLIMFGSISEDIKDEMLRIIDGKTIQYVGWINSDYSYDFFSAANLVVFPGTHSVLWEQAVAQGVPLLVKYWQGMTHIDIGGNCVFLYKDSTDEIVKIIEKFINEPTSYKLLVDKAQDKSKDNFRYSQIARKSLE